MKPRCAWVTDDPLYLRYHDEEWGEPVHDDRILFEFLVLETFQAGLSWLTILRKRENFRRAFDGFDYLQVATYGEAKIAALLEDKGIVRNRLKVRAAVTNAQAFIQVQQAYGSFDAYLWTFVDGKPKKTRWDTHADVPATTDLSDRLSKDLKQRGFKFVGSTVVYAYMQATGLVNDHTADCFKGVI